MEIQRWDQRQPHFFKALQGASHWRALKSQTGSDSASALLPETLDKPLAADTVLHQVCKSGGQPHNHQHPPAPCMAWHMAFISCIVL